MKNAFFGIGGLMAGSMVLGLLLSLSNPPTRLQPISEDPVTHITLPEITIAQGEEEIKAPSVPAPSVRVKQIRGKRNQVMGPAPAKMTALTRRFGRGHVVKAPHAVDTSEIGYHD